MQHTMTNPTNGDVRVVPAELQARYAGRGWVEAEADTEADTQPDRGGESTPVLRGAALDEALEAAGLSKSGTADEKRARLAEHRPGDPAGDPSPTPTSTPDLSPANPPALRS